MEHGTNKWRQHWVQSERPMRQTQSRKEIGNFVIYKWPFDTRLQAGSWIEFEIVVDDGVTLYYVWTYVVPTDDLGLDYFAKKWHCLSVDSIAWGQRTLKNNYVHIEQLKASHISSNKINLNHIYHSPSKILWPSRNTYSFKPKKKRIYVMQNLRNVCLFVCVAFVDRWFAIFDCSVFKIYNWMG